MGSLLSRCRLSRELPSAAGSPVPLPCGDYPATPHRGHKTGTVPLLWGSARNGPGTPPGSSEISTDCMEPHNAHLKPYSLSNPNSPRKAQALPGELAQSLCSASVAVWHVHSMGRPSAASVAHSLVNGWIKICICLRLPILTLYSSIADKDNALHRPGVGLP